MEIRVHEVRGGLEMRDRGNAMAANNEKAVKNWRMAA